MTTLTIQIPDKDKTLFEQLAKRLNGRIINAEGDDTKKPNAITIRAMSDARKGKTHKITDLDAFFASI